MKTNLISRSRYVDLKKLDDELKLFTKDYWHTFDQVEVLSETEFMIPDTMRRLEKGIDELQEFVVCIRVLNYILKLPLAYTLIDLQETNWAAISDEESEQLESAKNLLMQHRQFDCASLGIVTEITEEERI